MSAKVSTLLNVAPGAGRYVFLLIGWNDYADPVRDELNRQADAFGMDLGPSGVLVQTYPQRMYEIAREVMGKPWPPEIAERFQSDQDPIILILDRDWQSFDPREHPFGIIWVSRFSNDPGAVRSDWIGNYYNPVRRHSTLGYLTPEEYELGYKKLSQLAA